MASREILPKDAMKALFKLGFFISHKKGSHVRLKHVDGRKVTIAIHPKPLSLGTLSIILRQAEINREKLDEVL